MAYTKTSWIETTARSLANLNKLETQYDEAIADAITLRADNTKQLKVETAASVPAAGTAGRLLFNTTDGVLYYDTGTVWKALPGRVFEAGAYPAGALVYYTETPGGPYSLKISNTSLAKLYEFTVAIRGTYRVFFGIQGYGAPGGYVTYMRIYKNGSAYGTQRSVPALTATDFSEDLAFEVGDLCQLYGYVSSEHGHLYNFYMGVSEPPYQ